MNDLTAWLRPAAHVHVGMDFLLFQISMRLAKDPRDQSPAAALKRIQLQLPHDAEHLLQGRVRIIKYVGFLHVI